MKKTHKRGKIFLISFCMLLLAGIGLYFVSTKARYKEIPPYNLFTYQTGSSDIATGEETIVATEN